MAVVPEAQIESIPVFADVDDDEDEFPTENGSSDRDLPEITQADLEDSESDGSEESEPDEQNYENEKQGEGGGGSKVFVELSASDTPGMSQHANISHVVEMQDSTPETPTAMDLPPLERDDLPRLETPDSSRRPSEVLFGVSRHHRTNTVIPIRDMPTEHLDELAKLLSSAPPTPRGHRGSDAGRRPPNGIAPTNLNLHSFDQILTRSASAPQSPTRSARDYGWDPAPLSLGGRSKRRHSRQLSIPAKRTLSATSKCPECSCERYRPNIWKAGACSYCSHKHTENTGSPSAQKRSRDSSSPPSNYVGQHSPLARRRRSEFVRRDPTARITSPQPPTGPVQPQITPVRRIPARERFDLLRRSSTADAVRPNKRKSTSRNQRSIEPPPRCFSCKKPAFKQDKVTVHKITYHLACFRCNECKTQLSLSDYAIRDNVVFCQDDYDMLFPQGTASNVLLSDNEIQELTRTEPEQDPRQRLKNMHGVDRQQSTPYFHGQSSDDIAQTQRDTQKLADQVSKLQQYIHQLHQQHGKSQRYLEQIQQNNDLMQIAGTEKDGEIENLLQRLNELHRLNRERFLQSHQGDISVQGQLKSIETEWEVQVADLIDIVNKKNSEMSEIEKMYVNFAQKKAAENEELRDMTEKYQLKLGDMTRKFSDLSMTQKISITHLENDKKDKNEENMILKNDLLNVKEQLILLKAGGISADGRSPSSGGGGRDGVGMSRQHHQKLPEVFTFQPGGQSVEDQLKARIKEVAKLEKLHKIEVQTLKSSYEQAIAELRNSGDIDRGDISYNTLVSSRDAKIGHLEDQVTTLQKKLNTSETNVKKANLESKWLKEQADNATGNMKQIREKATSEVKSALKKLHRTERELNREILRLKEEIQEKNEEIADLQEACEHFQALNSAPTSPMIGNVSPETLKAENYELKAGLEAKTTENDKLMEKINNMFSGVDDGVRLAQLEGELKRLTVMLDAADQQKKDQVKVTDHLRGRIDSLQTKMKQLINESRKRIKNVQSQTTEYKKRCSELEHNLRLKETTCEKQRTKLMNLRVEHQLTQKQLEEGTSSGRYPGLDDAREQYKIAPRTLVTVANNNPAPLMRADSSGLMPNSGPTFSKSGDWSESARNRVARDRVGSARNRAMTAPNIAPTFAPTFAHQPPPSQPFQYPQPPQSLQPLQPPQPQSPQTQHFEQTQQLRQPQPSQHHQQPQHHQPQHQQPQQHYTPPPPPRQTQQHDPGAIPQSQATQQPQPKEQQFVSSPSKSRTSSRTRDVGANTIQIDDMVKELERKDPGLAKMLKLLKFMRGDSRDMFHFGTKHITLVIVQTKLMVKLSDGNMLFETFVKKYGTAELRKKKTVIHI